MSFMDKEDNKGYATLELTLIMPLLILMIVMIAGIFIDAINDGDVRAKSYVYLYTYTKDSNKNETGSETGLPFGHAVIGGADTGASVNASGGEVSVSLYHVERSVRGGYTAGSSTEYKTEYDKTSGRLRRWQLYGDYLWE
ncbi:MAG: pilus assembly protein [Lachnospiraceae bacterium]|nr:pilus assembly protein [Lachnospiraceae bacterium]